MSCFLSIACPQTKVLVRREFLHDMDQQHAGEYERGIAHRVIVEPGHAIRFSVLLETGALYYGLPIHALCVRECEPMPLHVLELWNAMSYHAAVYRDPWRAGLDVDVKLGNGEVVRGTCLFSIDFVHAEPQLSDGGWTGFPDEKKEAHIIELDSGHLAAQPGNRIVWLDASYVSNPIDLRQPKPCTYQRCTRTWSVEGRRRSDDSNNLFYQVEIETPCEPTPSTPQPT